MKTTKPNTRYFPWHGWVGLAILVLGEVGLALNLSWVATWFTPIMWTGYIVLGDSFLKRFAGQSWISDRWRELPLITLLSILVWLLFEAYNLHLKNWIYQGLPDVALWRDFGYFWSFATIMPGVFITFRLLEVFVPAKDGDEIKVKSVFKTGPAWAWFLLGLFLIIFPLLLSSQSAAYLFALVWIGFIFFLDPINEKLNLPSLRKQISQGRWRPLLHWLAAGFICGLVWETWNFQALHAGGAHWIYTVPQELRITGLHFGQMPVEGLLGFPPFAIELRSFYLWFWKMLGGERTFGPSLMQG